MAEIQQLTEEYSMGFGAEEANNFLDNPNLAAAMKKMLELQLQVILIPIVKRIVGPMMENMVRKVVKEEIEWAQEKFFNGEKWNSGDGHVTQVQQLELQFSEDVPELFHTGEEIKGQGGNHLILELVDPLTRSRVSSVCEASAEVELIVRSEEESEDVKCPVLSQTRVKMKDGIAVLDDIKFKHKQEWTKKCKVILVAQANLSGMIVKEAETIPFCVMDRRTNLYTKRYPPCLSDDVCRLKEISRGSQLHKDLRGAKVNTVEEFLRSLNMKPDYLKQILNVSAEKFKIIVDHAKTCLIGENLYLYSSTSSERKARAVFNIVGCLRGLLYDDKYIPVDKLSEEEKDDAHKILKSAFEDFNNAEAIENEASIGQFVSQSSNANGANPSSSLMTENAFCTSFSPRHVVRTSEGVKPFENEASTIHLASGSSKGNGANISSSPRTENAAGSTLSPEIFRPAFVDVEPNENEASTALASGSSNANAADTSSSSLTNSIAGSNSGIGKISESDNAFLSTLLKDFSRLNSFDRYLSNASNLFLDNNMDISGLNHSIYPSSANEELDVQQLFLIEEDSNQRTTAGDMQMTGIHVPSSTMARQRWQMAAIRIVALVDTQARKKRRLS